LKIRLVTFADGSVGLRAAGRRLAKQADATGWFSEPSKHWTLETLRKELPDFYYKNEIFIRNHPRGLGLWLWKPAILSYLIDTLNEGEMILFLDSGCQFNSTDKSKIRFNEYLDLTSKNDMLLMQLVDGSFGFQNVTDSAWTKSSVLRALDPDSEFRESNQIQSGIIFAVKSERSQRIANQWLRYCTYSNFSYLLDPSDSEAQSPDFIQHRWEQSILSLILKSEKINPILDETYFFPDWQKGSDFPIWAMRNRSGGDAARRNTFDIFKILTAKIERRVLEFYRNFF
jgi:hypothetical protein